jgi:hypothetical protein
MWKATAPFCMRALAAVKYSEYLRVKAVKAVIAHEAHGTWQLLLDYVLSFLHIAHSIPQ